MRHNNENPETPNHRRRYSISIGVRLGIVVLCLVLAAPAPFSLEQQHLLANAAESIRLQNYADALADYQAALPFQLADATLWTRLIILARQVHRPDMAISYIEQAASRNGWTPAYYRLMAEVLSEQGDSQRALPYWQAALTGSADNDVPILKQLGLDALAQQDWATGSARFTQILTLSPDDAFAQFQLGTLMAATDPAQALDHLEKAARDPRYAPTLTAINDVYIKYSGGSSAQLSFQIGLALVNAQVWPQAEHALALALGNGLDNAATLAFMALAQDHQNRDGWSLLNRALLLAPDDPLVNYALAVHWRLKGDHEKALEALDRAGTIDPTDAAIAAELGLTYREERLLPDAAQWLNKAVALAPDDVRFQILLATFYADENYDLTGEGLTTLEGMAQKFPKEATILASLGAAYLAANQLDAAKQRLQQALEIDDTNLRARYYFAQYLEAMNNSEAALHNYLFVYQNGGDSLYRTEALRNMRAIGYQPSLSEMIGNSIP